VRKVVPIEKPKVVLCEGPFDQAVLSQLAKAQGLDIDIRIYGGKDNLKNFMPAFRKQADFAKVETLLVTRDADESEEDAFKSVRDTLKNSDLLPPSGNGTFSCGGTPKVGVFIIGVDGRGAMEDLCLTSVRDRPEFPCVEQHFVCTGRGEPNSKLRAWAWLVSYPDFECTAIRGAVGKAETDYWNLEHAVFDPLKAFLKAM
jgi:hypothetical protein